MFGSDWLYILAAGLAGLCLAGASAGERVTVNETVLDCVPEGCFVVRNVPEVISKPERKSDQSSTSGTDEPTEETREAYPEIIPSGTRSEAPADHPPAAEETDYSYDNLQANRWIRNWTGLAALATVAGVILIWRTLKYTKDAAIFAKATLGEAENATDAARKTIKVTRKMGKAQVRAYLSCIGGSVSTSTDNRWEMAMNLVFFNTGNSPARKVQYSGVMLVVKRDGGEYQLKHFHQVSPGKIHEIGGRDRRHKQYKMKGGNVYKFSHDLIFQGCEFVFLGSLKYRDVFKKPITNDFAVFGRFKSVNANSKGIFKAKLKPAVPDGWYEIAGITK